MEVQALDKHYDFLPNPAWDAFSENNCAYATAEEGQDLGLPCVADGKILVPIVAIGAENQESVSLSVFVGEGGGGGGAPHRYGGR